MRKYLAYYRVAIQDTLAYRGPMFVWLLGNILSMVIAVAVWLTVEADGDIGGYSKNSLVTYYIFGLFFQWLLNWLTFFPVSDSIKDGSIVGSSLTKPVCYWWKEFAREAGWHTISVIFGTSTTVLACIVFWEYLEFPTQINFIWLILASIIGVLTNFSMTLCMALVAFWTTEIGSLNNFFWLGRFFLGGQGFPVSFLVGYLGEAVYWTPFRYTFSFPLEILTGQLTGVEIIKGFIIGIIWIIFFICLYKILWVCGQRVYTSFGQ